jgi:hypothetical protein
VAFFGAGASSQQGIYTSSTAGGPLAMVADRNTAVTNGTGNFVSFSSVSVSGSTAAFYGRGSGTQRGIYAGAAGGGGLVRVADTGTAVPNGTGNFTDFQDFSIATSGPTVVFGGRGTSGQQGVYAGPTAGGPLTIVANTSSAIPSGTGNFSTFVDMSVSGSEVAFYGTGSSNQRGVYAGTTGGGPLTRVADRNTAIPNGSGTFLFAFQPSVSGSAVAFMGVGGTGSGAQFSQEGIYVGSTSGGPVSVVADFSTPIPGGIGTFTSLFQNGPAGLSLSGSTVAFRGLGSNGQDGIYMGSIEGGPLVKVIAAGDSLDGRTVANLEFGFGEKGLDGNTLAFEVNFTNGTSGVYVFFAPVPEPATVLGLAAVGLWGVRLLRRRVTC